MSTKKRPTKIQPWQIQMIHTIRRAMWGDDRDTYEQLLDELYAAASCKDLGYGEANDFINRLKALQEGKPMPPMNRRGALWATFLQLQKIEALAGWIGLASDERLNGFIFKQTGRKKTKYMLTFREATKIIIGLQKWASRGDGELYTWLNEATPATIRANQQRRKEINKA